MRAKEYLNQIRFLDKEIQSLLEQVSKLRSSLERCTTRITDEPRKTNTGDSLPDTVSKIIELENKIDGLADKQIDLKGHIISKISCMESSLYRTILIHRYINFKKWEEIARTLHYSRAQINRLHAVALKEFDNKYYTEKFSGRIGGN